MEINLKTTQKEEFIEVTSKIETFLQKQNKNKGFIHVYCPHTTAALTINENADPSVKKDLLTMLDKIIPQNLNYSHTEGNSPAHIKSSLIGSSLTLPFQDKSLSLGRWQGIFFCEFDGPRERKINIIEIS